jgi:hypothetical protein
MDGSVHLNGLERDGGMVIVSVQAPLSRDTPNPLRFPTTFVPNPRRITLGFPTVTHVLRAIVAYRRMDVGFTVESIQASSIHISYPPDALPVDELSQFANTT